MNTRNTTARLTRAALFFLLLPVLTAPAATQYWGGGSGNITPVQIPSYGSGTWDGTTQNWADDLGGTSYSAWGGDVGQFKMVDGTVTVSGTRAVNEMRFYGDDTAFRTYTFTGGTIDVGTSGLQLLMTNSVSAATIFRVVFDSKISGSGAITNWFFGWKNNSWAYVRLNGDNDFSGDIYLQCEDDPVGGNHSPWVYLEFSDTNNLGATANTVHLGGGAGNKNARLLALQDFVLDSGCQTWNILSAGGFGCANGGDAITIKDATKLTGTATCGFAGGTLILDTGGAQVYGGTIAVGASSTVQLGNGAEMPAIIDLAGGTLHITNSTALPRALNTSQGEAWIDIDAGVTAKFDGNLGAGNSERDYYFIGQGVAILADANGNTYAGADDNDAEIGMTYVQAGTVLVANVTSSGTGGSGIEVDAGATFGGAGIVKPILSGDGDASYDLTMNGTLAPGTNGAGTLTLDFDSNAFDINLLIFGSGSTIAFDVGTESDLIAFDTAGDWLRGSSNATLALTTNDGFSHANSYVIFSNVTTVGFAITNITGYDEGTYTPQFARSGNDYVLSFLSAGASYTVSESTMSVVEGGSATFTVVLGKAPSGNVAFNIASDNTGEAIVSPTALTFTSGDWNLYQTITITAPNDGDTGSDYATVTVSIDQVNTLDNEFDPLADQTVDLTLLDDDSDFSVSTATLSINEGETNTFTVVLDTVPAGNVELDVSTGNPGDVSVDKAELTFTVGNWNTPQTVEVIAVDDVGYGNVDATITVSVDDANSDDAFDAAPDKTVEVNITDDDTVVINNLDGPTGSLRQRLTDCPAGSTITFKPGIGTIWVNNAAGNIDVSKSFTILGPGPGNQIIDGDGNTDDHGGIFEIDSAAGPLFISGLTFTNGAGAEGGAMWIDADCTISNCIFALNAQGATGADDGGGAIYQEDTGTMLLIDCVFSNNSALRPGGALDIARSPEATVIRRCVFTGNTTAAAQSGGAIFTYSAADPLTIDDCEFTGNAAGGGGGAISLVGYTGHAAITNCTFTGNTAGGSGGGVYLTGEFAINNCEFRANGAGSVGGAIAADSQTAYLKIGTIDDVTIMDNWADGGGGALYMNSADVEIRDSTIASNTATGVSGGGIYVIGSGGLLLMERCAIYSNVVSAAAGDGGAVYSSANNVRLVNCTISANEAGDDAGGVIVTAWEDARLFMHSCTVYGNSSVNSPEGGVYRRVIGTAEIYNSIIATNTGSGGPSDLDGEIDVLSHSVYQVENATINSEVSTLVTNPALSGLADNGGPTLTHAIQDKSPVIDIGVPANELRYVIGDYGQWIASVTGITGIAAGDTDNGLQYLTMDAVNDTDWRLDIFSDIGRTTRVAYSDAWTRGGGTETVAMNADGGSSMGGSVDIRTTPVVFGYENGDGQQNQITNWTALTGVKLSNSDVGTLYVNIVDEGGGNFRADIYSDAGRSQLVGHTVSWQNGQDGGKAVTADNSSGLGGELQISTAHASAPSADSDIYGHYFPIDLRSVLVTSIETDQRGSGYPRVLQVAADPGAYEWLATVGFELQPTSVEVDEDGGINVFTVVLLKEPTNNVVLDVTSDAPGEAQPTPTSLTFDAGDWDIPQTVTVTGQNDGDTGHDYATITVAIDTDNTHDGSYDPVGDQTVDVTILDDDSGFTVSTAAITMWETNETATFTVKLTALPQSSDVVLSVSNAPSGEVTTDKAELTFTAGDWNTPQTVTITATDDTDWGIDYATITVSVIDARSDSAFHAAPDRTIALTLLDEEPIVLNNLDGPVGSLRERVGAAPAGGTIIFNPGIGTILLNNAAGNIDITSEVTIQGPGPDSQIIDGNGNTDDHGGIFDITGGPVFISGLTFTNGAGAEGGAVYVNADCTISNCVFKQNTQSTAGADNGGGAVYQDDSGTMLLTDCIFSNNAAVNAGGAVDIANGPTATTIRRCVLANNTCNWAGGAIYTYRSADPLTIEDCQFTDNEAGGAGGAVSLAGGLGNAAITNCSFTGNTAGGAGGGLDLTGAFTINDCMVTGNDAGAAGGAIAVGNQTQYRLKGTIENITVTGNWAGGGGGALYMTSSDVELRDSTIASNTATGGHGGGVHVVGSGGLLLMERCTVASNKVLAAGGDGGAMYTEANNVRLVNCTISGNEAGDDAGGVIVTALADARLFMLGCTVYGNSSVNSPEGGVYRRSNGAAEIYSSIVATNIGSGGPSDLDGNIDVLSHSVYQVENATISSEISTLVTNPMLNALADNGGPTLTHAIEYGNPIINVGLASNAMRYVYPDYGQWIASVTGITGIAAGDTHNGLQYLTIDAVNDTDWRLDIFSDTGRTTRVAYSDTWTLGGGTETVAMNADGGSSIGGNIEIRATPVIFAFEEGDGQQNQITNWTALTGVKLSNSDVGTLYVNTVDTGDATNFRADIYSDRARTVLVAQTETWADGFNGAVAVTNDNGSGIGGELQVSTAHVSAPSADPDIYGHFWPIDQRSVLVTLIGTDQRGTGYTRTYGAASDPGAYEYIAVPGYVLDPTGVAVLENSGTETFTVVLTAEPTGNVVLDITSDATGEATVAPPALTFTAGNWTTPQTVTVTGVNDGDTGHDYATVTLAINADDTLDIGYDTVASQTLDVTVLDDDSSFTVSETSFTLWETNETATFTVTLTALPQSSDVIISISNAPAGEVSTDKAELTFTSGNWNIPQMVTVTAIDDTDWGTDYATITISVVDAESDPAFHAALDRTIDVTLLDEEPIVLNNLDGPVGSLRERIGSAPAGATITFLPGIGTIVLTQGVNIDIAGDVTIQGPGPGSQIVDGNGNTDEYGGIFQITVGPVFISGLTFTNGAGQEGGAVWVNADCTFSNCVFTQNAQSGTGADDGGGAIYQETIGTMLLTDCVFSNNAAVYPGGAIDIAKTPAGTVIRRCVFVENTTAASRPGGAIFTYQAADPVVVEDCEFADNEAGGDGGAICLNGGTGQALITNCTFTSNTAGDSGLEDGGALYLNSGVVLANSTLTGNEGSWGGAIYAVPSFYYGKVMSISDCVISNNTTRDGGGGGLYLNGDVEIRDTIIADNTGGGSQGGNGGGGIYATSLSQLLIERCAVFGNTCVVNVNVDGGGILSYGSLHVVNSTIANNTANDEGGAVWIAGPAVGCVSVLHSCTIRGNRSLLDDEDGIHHNNNAEVSIVNSIISSNYNDEAGDEDLSGDLALVSYCIYGDSDATITTLEESSTGDPLLEPLAYDGNTWVYPVPQYYSTTMNSGATTDRLNYVYPNYAGWIDDASGLIGVTTGNTDNGLLYLSIINPGGGNQWLLELYKDSARTELVGHTASWTQDTGDTTLAVVADGGSGLGGTIDIRTDAFVLTTEQGDGIDQITNWVTIAGVSHTNSHQGTLYAHLASDGGGFFHIDLYKDTARTELVGHTAQYQDGDNGSYAITADNGSGLGGYIGVSTLNASAPREIFPVGHYWPIDRRSVLVTEITTDQRGAGHPRVLEGRADVGAYEVIPPPRGTLFKIY